MLLGGEKVEEIASDSTESEVETLDEDYNTDTCADDDTEESSNEG